MPPATKAPAIDHRGRLRLAIADSPATVSWTRSATEIRSAWMSGS
jgi:hypothetical protein